MTSGAALQLTTVGNDDLLGGLAALRAERLDLLDDVHTLDDAAEDDVLTVQPVSSEMRANLSSSRQLKRWAAENLPWAWNGGQEKLRTVGVWSGVGHGQKTWRGVLKLEVLVLELVAVDALAASSVLVGEVATLAPEKKRKV